MYAEMLDEEETALLFQTVSWSSIVWLLRIALFIDIIWFLVQNASAKDGQERAQYRRQGT